MKHIKMFKKLGYKKINAWGIATFAREHLHEKDDSSRGCDYIVIGLKNGKHSISKTNNKHYAETISAAEILAISQYFIDNKIKK